MIIGLSELIPGKLYYVHSRTGDEKILSKKLLMLVKIKKEVDPSPSDFIKYRMVFLSLDKQMIKLIDSNRARIFGFEEAR